MSTPQRDVVDALAADGRAAEQLFGQVERGKAKLAKRRRQFADVVTAEVVRHLVAEERYLYPTVRRAISDGDAVADEELSRNVDAEKMMKRLAWTKPGSPEFENLLRTVIQWRRKQIRREERVLSPKLRKACTKKELRELGRRFDVARAAAPTRPHPRAPHKPPLLNLVSVGTGMADKVRDAATGRVTSRADLRATSRHTSA